MDKKKVGLALVGFSILLSLTNLSITGAVIGGTANSWMATISALFIIIGFLLINRSGLEEAVGVIAPTRAARRLNRVQGHGSLVVDTSYLGEYGKQEFGELLEHLDKGYERIVLTDGVLEELQRGPRRGNIDLYFEDDRGASPSDHVDKYLKEARTYLEHSGKKLVYDKVAPILEGKASADTLKRSEAVLIRREMKKMLGWLKEDGIRNPNEKDLLRVLDRHYEVSDVDVEVLAAAIAEAYDHPGKKITIAGKDRDFEYALELMKHGGEGITPHKVGRQLVYSSTDANVR